MHRAWLFLLLVLAAVVLAAAFHGRAAAVMGGAAAAAVGGGAAAASPHLVVDTLNVAGRPPRGADFADHVEATIRRAAGVLRPQFPGELVFVLKERESGDAGLDAAGRERLAALAEALRVRIAVAQRYADPPPGGAAPRSAEEAHAARGRDDFYMAYLADKYRCAVLTDDRLRDFDAMKRTLRPFYAVTYDWYSPRPSVDYIRPDAFAKLRRPRRVPVASLLAI